ncbi:DMT family transporter [Neptuniibacter marinus]|uniref:DMT family transporter n=1 Tax=Neptuniibacter marinus TaxID=1806670 RepID=UPI0008358F06|nr:SMR family transporter [Neptuniibacter marinus]
MGWVYLAIAGLIECGWAIGLKYSDGFTRLWPSVISAVLIVVSLGLLSLAMRTIPVGTAYAAWSGIGAVALASYGIIFLGESGSFVRILCIFLIVTGLAGLKFFE